MRIKVEKIIETENIIVFETPLGKGKGVWMSKTRPQLNNYYEVEFEIPDSLTWEENAFFAKDNREIIEIDDNFLCIQGRVEEVEQDGLVVLRLGDSVVMLENFVEPPPLNAYVCLRVGLPQLFNSNV